MGLKIRKIEKNEYPSFAPTADKIAEMCFSAEYGVMLMAETETGYPIGYVAARENLIVTELMYIYIKPLFRGRGIATELFSQLMEFSRNPVSICVYDDHPQKEILLAFVRKFELEHNFSASTYISEVQKCVQVHEKFCENRYKRISDFIFKRGCTLRRFDECGEGLVDLLSDMVGEEFAYNTNPALYSSYDGRYSYCLFDKNEVPVAFSFIHTNGDTAVFHLLSRAKHSPPGAFLCPLVRTYTDFIAGGIRTVTFTVYTNNSKMRALSDNDFIAEYVNKVRHYSTYTEKVGKKS